MRVATDQRLLTAEPGATLEVPVDVVNTGDLIDGVTARVIGLPDARVTVTPELLPLFPDGQGQLTLSIEVPTSQPAGMHPLTIEVISHGSGEPSQHVDIDLSVSARPGVRLTRTPQVQRARRSARFELLVENTGNVALDVELATTKEDRRTSTRFTPASMELPPGGRGAGILTVRGPRMFTGSEIDRTVGVDLTARRAHSIPAMDETEQEPELVDQAVVRLRQRPLISRGLLTVLILAAIVALWALVFLLGLRQVFAQDAMTKTPAVSFFPVSASSTDGADPGADGATEGGGAGGAGGEAPPGAMSKSGLLPAGVGGAISGTVIATSNDEPVGRILVEAQRKARTGGWISVSSAATQRDGTYVLAGLFPTEYRLKFSAPGFKDLWYPDSPGRAGGEPVAVAAQEEADGKDVVVTGLPGSIAGTVDPGSALAPFTTRVVARVLGPTALGGIAAQTTTDAAGRYTLRNLKAPATYELSFTAEGYRATTVITTVGGGKERLQPSVVLGSGEGQVTGRVTDGKSPLGNVTVSTTVDGEEVAVITPTVGAVGAFTLGNLPTPGTYVLTFSKPGHGSRTEIVDLDAGTSTALPEVVLRAGTGTVSGTLSDAEGDPVGGAQVTVGGALVGGGVSALAGAPSTVTLTEGKDAGAFTLSGLSVPGDYTLTFTLPGYAPTTVPVSLTTRTASEQVKAVLVGRLGRITGQVRSGGEAFVGAVVTATNGTDVITTTSSGAGGALPTGGYVFPGLEPGTYSVTVSTDGHPQVTQLIEVGIGGTTEAATIRFPAGGD
ncbi:carboxypeptidase regulatory-like domain-containing protein [Nocardioides sp.]|uniref:carboxypeptidase regulatory-like domain-containing protein n=1 Tax=Nocardioides sp. TaxID=35761 RepID=UPI003564D290